MKVLQSAKQRCDGYFSFGGRKVLRDYVIDFYCHKSALVVEVDGDIHDLQQEEDARREKALRELGLRVVRFGNDEVMNTLPVVVERIKEPGKK